MDTTQEELIAALVRRLEGRKPLSPRREDRVEAGEPELDVLIELEPSGDQVKLG
ncbi:MAG: hypothetical protein KY461_02865 [Actinobacteria bacterium]|nr:hypothetical protein [Actinomycetota bacterium]